jgi:hypothetical protein
MACLVRPAWSGAPPALTDCTANSHQPSSVLSASRSVQTRLVCLGKPNLHVRYSSSSASHWVRRREPLSHRHNCTFNTEVLGVWRNEAVFQSAQWIFTYSLIIQPCPLNLTFFAKWTVEHNGHDVRVIALGPWFRSPLEAWMSVSVQFVGVCCPV